MSRDKAKGATPEKIAGEILAILKAEEEGRCTLYTDY